MKAKNQDFDAFLDQAIAAVRDDKPDAEVAQQAADRAWQRLQESLASGEEAAPQAQPLLQENSVSETDAAARIRSHEDYLALIPAYLAGELPASSELLIEDYARESIPFRKALGQARDGQDRSRAMAPRRTRVPKVWMAIAAGLIVALGATTFMLLSDYFAGTGPQARVHSADGQLFRLEGDMAVALSPGDTVRRGEQIRTSKNGGAVIELNDGSRVEMRARSEISVEKRRGETTVRVDRGNIIVEAAQQRTGRLYVATEDCLVSVTGTIFSVNHGTKGSRVSVIEGEVRVEQLRRQTVLEPGQQLATNAALGTISVAEEISWSRDEKRYQELLSELQALNAEFGEALSQTGLRYESPMLALAPPETTIYLGLPNLSDEVGDMQAILKTRLAESEVLRDWWQEKVDVGGTGEEIDALVNSLRGLGEHLGREVIVAVSRDDDGDLTAPLILAQVERPAAFAATLATEVERLNAASNDEHLTIIGDPASVPASDDHEVLLWLAGDVFAAAIRPEELQALAARMANGPQASSFESTPFHGRLLEAYAQGAQWLAGLDAASIFGSALEDGMPSEALRFSGLSVVEHLIVERKQAENTVHTGAVLTFGAERSGALSWLAEPAPMGSLDFISPDANLAVSSVVEQPAAVMEQILTFLDEVSPGVRPILEGFERGYGIDLESDLAAPLGGEVTVAFDGPALPTPSWKIVVEVYDPARLQSTLDLLARRVGQTVVINGEPVVSIEQQTIGGRTYYSVPQVAKVLGKMVAGFHFTYEDGYLLIAPSQALLDRAIQVRDNGYSLTDSSRFRDLLPPDGYVNFSAIAFTDVGSLGDTISRFASAMGEGAGDGEEMLSQVGIAMVPTLTCAYGEPDRIRVVSTSQGGALAPLLARMLGMSEAGGPNV